MAHTSDHQTELADQEFYEVMPYAGPAPRQETLLSEAELDRRHDEAAAARLTAVITLITVGIIVLALGFLIARGLQAVHDSSPGVSTSNDF